MGHRLARRIVRIGSGVVARGEIDEDAVDRAVPLLAAFSAVIRDDRLTRVRTVATGVLRDAANATQTVARLSAVLESPFHVLPGLQERGRQRRRLARRGCAGGLDRPVG